MYYVLRSSICFSPHPFRAVKRHLPARSFSHIRMAWARCEQTDPVLQHAPRPDRSELTGPAAGGAAILRAGRAICVTYDELPADRDGRAQR